MGFFCCYTQSVNLILELFFPKRCVGCKRFGVYLCSSCIGEIKQSDLVCPKCERAAVGGATHPICKRKYGLDGLWYLGIYQDPLKKAIQKLKYKWVKEISSSLVDLITAYWVHYQPYLFDLLKKRGGGDWIITSVPLHKRRQNWRGFNQSELLAKDLAQKLGLKYQNLLIRTRYTTPQVQLKSYQRHQNIKNAFTLDSRLLRLDSNILIVDDVWTTGATLKECCYVLKRSGAKQVWALTLTR